MVEPRECPRTQTQHCQLMWSPTMQAVAFVAIQESPRKGLGNGLARRGLWRSPLANAAALYLYKHLAGELPSLCGLMPAQAQLCEWCPGGVVQCWGHGSRGLGPALCGCAQGKALLTEPPWAGTDSPSPSPVHLLLLTLHSSAQKCMLLGNGMAVCAVLCCAALLVAARQGGLRQCSFCSYFYRLQRKQGSSGIEFPLIHGVHMAGENLVHRKSWSQCWVIQPHQTPPLCFFFESSGFSAAAPCCWTALSQPVKSSTSHSTAPVLPALPPSCQQRLCAARWEAEVRGLQVHPGSRHPISWARLTAVVWWRPLGQWGGPLQSCSQVTSSQGPALLPSWPVCNVGFTAKVLLWSQTWLVAFQTGKP